MENERRRLNEDKAVDQPDGFGTDHEYVVPDEDPLQAALARAHAIAANVNFELSD